MNAPPYPQHYRLLRSQGLTPVAAAIAVCRANKDNIPMIMYRLATKEAEPGVLRERWIKYVQAENKERVWLLGYVSEGCYFYSSLVHRPDYTVFIPWSEIESIWIQDGLNLLSLCLYSVPQEYGCKFFQAQNDMQGFEAFVEEVSRRFFGAPDYLKSRFKIGEHPVRKIQVWSKDQSAEAGAPPNGGPAERSGTADVSGGPPSVS